MHTGCKALPTGAEGVLRVDPTVPVLIARATKPHIGHTFFGRVVKIVPLCQISAVLWENRRRARDGKVIPGGAHARALAVFSALGANSR